jgi:hypothetical protein
MAKPSSSLYSAVSLVRNDEFNTPPDGPTGITLAQTCETHAHISGRHSQRACLAGIPATAQ